MNERHVTGRFYSRDVKVVTLPSLRAHTFVVLFAATFF